MTKTLSAIRALSDDELLDHYLKINLKAGELDLTDNTLRDLLRIEWNRRHPDDPMPSAKAEGR